MHSLFTTIIYLSTVYYLPCLSFISLQLTRFIVYLVRSVQSIFFLNSTQRLSRCFLFIIISIKFELCNMRQNQKSLKIVIKSDSLIKLKKISWIVTLGKRMREKQKQTKIQVKEFVLYVFLLLMTTLISVFYHQFWYLWTKCLRSTIDYKINLE